MMSPVRSAVLMSSPVPTHFDFDAIKRIALDLVPEWKALTPADISVHQMTAGLTNKLHKVETNEGVVADRKKVLFRVFGEANGCFYEPEFERSVFRVVSTIDNNFAPALIGEFNGGRIEAWIEGAPLPVEYGRCTRMLHEVANCIMRFHAISDHPDFPKDMLARPVCQFDRIQRWMEQADNVVFPAGSRCAKVLEKYDLPYRRKCLEHLKNVLCLKDAPNPVLVDLKGEVYEPCPYMMRVLFAHNDCQDQNFMRPVEYVLPGQTKPEHVEEASTTNSAAEPPSAHEVHDDASRAYALPTGPSMVFEKIVTTGEDGRHFIPSSAPVIDCQPTSDMPVPPCWLTNARQTCTCVPPVAEPLDAQRPKLRLIDYEYSDVNFAGFDLASYLDETMVDYWRCGGEKSKGFAISPEGYPSDALRRDFVRSYLRAYFSTINRAEEPTEYEVERAMRTVDRCGLISHLVWTWWSIIRAGQEPEGDFDFITYGLTRAQQYDATVKKLNLPRAGEEHLVEEKLQKELETKAECKGCLQA